MEAIALIDDVDTDHPFGDGMMPHGGFMLNRFDCNSVLIGLSLDIMLV
nr:hypothetical protein [Methylomarinum sp. Ch1-1]MDP4520469.1 hypothetical protein [Methylomarinum sp. Ch1-1]